MTVQYFGEIADITNRTVEEIDLKINRVLYIVYNLCSCVKISPVIELAFHFKTAKYREAVQVRKDQTADTEIEQA